MQSRFEWFDKLPQELKIKTAQYLSNPDLVSFARTSNHQLTLFKPMMNVHKLLQHVVRGEHEATQAMLKKDISLMFKKGKVTDYSGRTFNNISPFEYTLWALDKHMWMTMLKVIPQSKEGQKVLSILLTQYNDLEKSGITYEFDSKTITEQHYDFAIVKELQKLTNLAAALGAPDTHNINKQWCEDVGRAQKNLPVHVVDEYCSDKPFEPIPDFISQPTSSRQFYNRLRWEQENWFSLNSKLGHFFAIYKGSDRNPEIAWNVGELFPIWAAFVVQVDLNALMALHKARTKDFTNLKSELEIQLLVDSQLPVFQI